MSISPLPLPERIDDESAMVRYLGALLTADGASGRRDLWVFMLDGDGHPLDPATCVDDVPADPAPRFTGNLFLLFRRTLASVAPDGSVAMALERPGPPQVCLSDRQWASALRWGARREGVRLHGPYLVVGGRVRRLPDGEAN
ncbi:MAG: hypothetical protein GEV07_03480 [Streptosporangiales bacterium]|nr:hypothetical protein [Streptosporangiales bacterium]